MPAPLVAAAATAPWWAPAAIGAAGSVVGGLATTGFNMFQSDKTRDFNREMSSTMHQREVDDLRKAGLNPVLSANHGGSAVAPAVSPQAGDFDATNKAMQGLQLASSLALQNAQIREVNATSSGKELENKIGLRTYNEKIDSIREQLTKLRNEVDMNTPQRKKLDQEISNLEIQSKILENEQSHSGLDLSRARSESRFYEGAGGDIEHWVKMLGINIPGLNLIRSRGIKGRNTGDFKSSGSKYKSGYDDFRKNYKKGGK